MTSDEIIRKDAEEAGLDPNQVLQRIKQEAASGRSLLLREGETILVLRKLDNNSAELSLFTEDQKMALSRAIRAFIKKIKQSDISTVYGKASNPEIVGLLEILGVDVEDSDLPQYNWKATVWAAQ